MRRVAVFVLLAAVFSMHGIPFLGADDAAGLSGNVTHAAMASMLEAAPVAGATPAHELFERTAEVASGHSGQSAPAESHGLSAHLWGACLAIIFAGIALLTLIVLSRRPGASPGKTAFRSTVTRIRPAPLRPPDLSVLCVLRT